MIPGINGKTPVPKLDITTHGTSDVADSPVATQTPISPISELRNLISAMGNEIRQQMRKSAEGLVKSMSISG